MVLLEDHKRRVTRLMRGERRVTDLDRLFADLRMMKPGRVSVREIGHFAAHRNERDTGISLSRANDIQTSAKLWHRQLERKPLTVVDLKAAARANFNIMSEERVRDRLGISRQTAMQSFRKGIRKLEAGKPLKARELEVINVFGLSMTWQFALDDRTLFLDFEDLLIQESALAESCKPEFENVFHFVSLYALSMMHGARLKMAGGDTARLRLAVSDSGMLRIKAEIPVINTPKPVVTSAPIFETSLNANTYCDLNILSTLEKPIPVEICQNRLVALV